MPRRYINYEPAYYGKNVSQFAEEDVTRFLMDTEQMLVQSKNKNYGEDMTNTWNQTTQYYKGIPIRLIIYTDAHFARLKAKRYMLGNPKYNQNIWIPNCYLKSDGTLKPSVDLDWLFQRADCKKKMQYAHISENLFI